MLGKTAVEIEWGLRCPAFAEVLFSSLASMLKQSFAAPANSLPPGIWTVQRLCRQYSCTAGRSITELLCDFAPIGAEKSPKREQVVPFSAIPHLICSGSLSGRRLLGAAKMSFGLCGPAHQHFIPPELLQKKTARHSSVGLF